MPPVLTARPTVPASRRSPSPPGVLLPERVRGTLRHAAPALAGYVAVRLLGLLVITRWSHLKGLEVWPTLATSWDSRWYLAIADHGYEPEPGEPAGHRTMAFFPLYPALVKAFAAVTPGSRASVGLALAVLCSLAAAWGIFAVGDRLYGRRVGTVLVVLWGALPVSAVQWMGYTESLFTALAAWALYAALDGRWAWAAGLAVGAGLTRPTGVAVAAAVSVAGLLAARRGSRRALAAALVAPLGWLGYVGWVGLRLGRWDGYFVVQESWSNTWDGGTVTLDQLRNHLVYDKDPQLFLVVVSLVLLAAVALHLLCVADRQPLPLLVFAGVLLLVVLGSGGVYFPRARFLLPGFPLLLPLALAVCRARRRVAALVLAAAALSSAWLGGYMLLVWPGPP
ncbi:hypothetical protein ACFV9D_22540 [Streptomyces sp. NPDC059875]|uniref:hypothetical protein n=1 Tax=unclassified Streptomyces TaxID=2593676 RepID=UPI0036653C8C